MTTSTKLRGNGPNSTWYPPFRDSLGQFIETSFTTFLTKGGCIAGLTLIVMGGVWRRVLIALPQKLPSKCAIQMWSSADVDRLVANERRWKLLLWKLSMQSAALENLGISLEATSDANMYSMWTHHDYRLIPSDDSIDSLNDIAFFPEFIFDMRTENRSGLDDHCVYRPDRAKWERVRRLHTRAYFKEDSARKTFGTLSRNAPGVLEGVVESAKRAWWVDCSTHLSDSFRNHLVYDLWETAVNWIDKIALTLDELIPELGSENLIFTLDVSEIVQHDEWTLEGIENLPSARAIPFRVLDRTVSLRLPLAFFAMGYSPKNTAERLLVKALVDGTLALAGVVDPDKRSEEIHLSLALSDDDRFMHLFLAKDARDYLHNLDREMPELLYDDEIAFGMIQIAQEAKLPAPSKLDTIEASNRALNQLVDAFWKRIEARLREIDRTNLITFCITNHERLLRDQDTWRRTSRAVLSLHHDRNDVLKETQRVKAKQDRIQITNRIMIEMAVCTCPLSGGRIHTQADIDYLGTQILLLIATAAQSDAVRARCTDASMRISRLGDFRLSNDFMEVMHPYLTSHFESKHMAEVGGYEGLFAPATETRKTEEEIFGTEFVETFVGEFGISPARLSELASRLTEDAITQRAFVVVQEMSSLTQILTLGGFCQNEIEGVLRSFVLMPRGRWDAVEKPFRAKDWFPWRYRRRLSLMARPFVDLGDGRVAYAPGFCEDSFRHTVMECFHGAFETEYFDSTRMKKYVGAVNARRGLDFNKAVGDVFREEGWNVRLELGMTELGAPPNEASGDIDVFAWKGNVLCACECKELLFARTVSEVADQLARFRGSPGDDLDKHLRRIRYLHSHPERVHQITSIKHPRIVPILVTSKIVPMQFVKGLTTEVISADQITSGLLESLLS